jgi:hypothetical protein
MKCADINKYIKIIENEPLEDIGRAADMLWLSFGKLVKVIFDYGLEEMKGSFAIHLQCPWRMVDLNLNTILFTSYDIYLPKSTIEWSEDFDWDIQGNNLCDEGIKKWKNKYNQPYVENINVSSLGDLRILLSNNNILETFNDNSTHHEKWRFFKNFGDERHLVVMGNCVSFD